MLTCVGDYKLCAGLHKTWYAQLCIHVGYYKTIDQQLAWEPRLYLGPLYSSDQGP
jgi:hypothetical protein